MSASFQNPDATVSGGSAGNTAKPSCEPVCYVGDRPACEVTWAPHVSAVFLGTVSDVKEENGPETVRLVVTVAVNEAFLGVERGTVTVTSGGESCGGLSFSKGKQYLIYAKRQADGTFTVALCGGTKPSTEASQDIEYLRNITYSAPRAGMIFGTVYRYVQPPNPNDKVLRRMQPFAGNAVTFKSKNASYEAVVSKDGKFRVENVEPGTYSVDVEVDDPVLVKTASGFLWRNPSQSAVIQVHATGCARVDLSIDPFHISQSGSAR